MPNTFHDFVASLNLSHFSANEILVNTGNPGNSIPPKRIWHNIVPTILILDRLRAELGKPIRLSSTYRNREYNHRIGGVKLSQHTAFTAIDFKVRNVTPNKVKKALVKWRDEFEEFALPINLSRKVVQVEGEDIGQKPLSLVLIDGNPHFYFDGGIGVYKTFVHLDTRGTNHLWYGPGVGEESA